MAITVRIVDDTIDIRMALEEIVRLPDDFKLLGSFPGCELYEGGAQMST